ncbi:MAG: hypothetical protein ACYC4Q_12570 [Victivallaceae bacterium]
MLSEKRTIKNRKYSRGLNVPANTAGIIIAPSMKKGVCSLLHQGCHFNTRQNKMNPANTAKKYQPKSPGTFFIQNGIVTNTYSSRSM